MKAPKEKAAGLATATAFDTNVNHDFTALAASFNKRLSIWRARCWLCRIFCGDTFTNADASREIDRLMLALELKQIRDEVRA